MPQTTPFHDRVAPLVQTGVWKLWSGYLVPPAYQYSVANEDMATCITGSANPERVEQWCDWLEQPLDRRLVAEVQEILKPVQNWFYIECLPENSDSEK